MTTINRARVVWGGTAVTGPGVSTFYSVGSGADLSNALFVYFNTIKTAFPPGVVWQMPSDGDTLDDNTGEINGTWSGGTGGPIGGTGSGAFAAGVGYRVVWNTGGITNGRHVRGSTFFCPIVTAAYDITGTIDDTIRGAQETAADNFLASFGPEELVILTRLTPTHNGTSHGVVSATIPDKVTWLKTRRT